MHQFLSKSLVRRSHQLEGGVNQNDRFFTYTAIHYYLVALIPVRNDGLWEPQVNDVI